MSLYNTLYKQVTVESRMLEMKSLKKKSYNSFFRTHIVYTSTPKNRTNRTPAQCKIVCRCY